MNVLMISYFFPPYGGGAVSRIHGFVKYLPDLGVNPYVLSLEPQYYNYEPHFFDDTLQTQYDESVKIFRSKIFLSYLYTHLKRKHAGDHTLQDNKKINIKVFLKKLLKIFLIPDGKILYWVPEAYKLGSDILTNHKIDLIYATVPPFSTHIIGYKLSRRFNKPLVLDFRDLYGSYQIHQQNPIKQRISAILERNSIAQSKKVIVTNEQAKKFMMDFHSLPGDKLKVIENGFDEDSLNNALKVNQNEETSKFIISYIGSLKDSRTPQFFLEAIKCFHERNPNFPIKIQLVGFIDPCHKNLINELELSSIVNIVEHTSQSKALEHMASSKVLLLLQRQMDGGNTAVPGKVYEYLATGIPIFTIDEGGGATTKFLNKLGISSVVEYTKPQIILSELDLLIKNYAQLHAKHQKIKKNHE
jgi:glycosyltransferase involved in cell wall biosynthesis